MGSLQVSSYSCTNASFNRIATRAEFVALLRRFESDFRATGLVPLLHIEAHGNDDGIGVSDAKGFTFLELMQELIPLNQLNLTVPDREMKGELGGILDKYLLCA